MHIKRFEGVTMPEAVRKVREEFGPDALVLASRRVRRDRGLFGRFGRTVVEVTAAVDRDHRARASGGDRTAPDRSWDELRLSRALIEPMEAELQSVRRAVDRLAADPQGGQSMASEVAELRRIAANLAGAHGAPATPAACHAAGTFLAAGLAPRHAHTLGNEAEPWLEDTEDRTAALTFTLAARLEQRLRPAREDDGQILMLVGPAGAGKTTTLAKVAARHAPEHLALISTDCHRFGAIEPLRHFARGLEVPFEVALSPEGLAETASRFRPRHLLVDTAGRSRRDTEADGELLRLRDALGERARIQIVVSATTKESDLRAQITRYRSLEPEGLVVTKTDESTELANVLNLLLDEETPPLAWLANGQRVPEDLMVPDPLELAQRAMENSP
jgi:flagellar biosynthesis protein FlhF